MLVEAVDADEVAQAQHALGVLGIGGEAFGDPDQARAGIAGIAATAPGEQARIQALRWLCRLVRELREIAEKVGVATVIQIAIEQGVQRGCALACRSLLVSRLLAQQLGAGAIGQQALADRRGADRRVGGEHLLQCATALMVQGQGQLQLGALQRVLAARQQRLPVLQGCGVVTLGFQRQAAQGFLAEGEGIHRPGSGIRQGGESLLGIAAAVEMPGSDQVGMQAGLAGEARLLRLQLLEGKARFAVGAWIAQLDQVEHGQQQRVFDGIRGEAGQQLAVQLLDQCGHVDLLRATLELPGEGLGKAPGVPGKPVHAALQAARRVAVEALRIVAQILLEGLRAGIEAGFIHLLRTEESVLVEGVQLRLVQRDATEQVLGGFA